MASKGRIAAGDGQRTAPCRGRGSVALPRRVLPSALRLLCGGGTDLPGKPSSGTQGLAHRIAQIPPRCSPEARLIPGICPTRHGSDQPDTNRAKHPRRIYALPKIAQHRAPAGTSGSCALGRSLAWPRPAARGLVSAAVRSGGWLVGPSVRHAPAPLLDPPPLAGLGLVLSGCSGRAAVASCCRGVGIEKVRGCRLGRSLRDR